METGNELQVDLQHRLMLLYRSITSNRDNGASQNEVEARTADFEMQWKEDLIKFQRVESSGRKDQAQKQIGDSAKQSHKDAEISDSERLPNIENLDDKLAFRASTNKGQGLVEAYEIAKEVNATNTWIEKEMTDKYESLRDALEASVIDIEQGKEPNFIFAFQQQLAKRQEVKEMTPERISEMKADIAKQREREQGRTPDDER